MSSAFDRIAARAAEEGRRLHARWDAARFDRHCRVQARALCDRLAEHPDPTDEATLAAYLTLLREATGSGYLGGTGHGAAPASFLEHALLRLIPDALAAEPPESRAGWLAKLWNLGEGMRGGAPWVDRYVAAFAGELTRVADVEGFLVRVLGPALEPARDAAWTGPFGLAVLDTREACDAFLPGAMHLAAPRVLCVQDRRDPAAHLGVLLRHGGQSRLLGPVPALAPYVEEGPLPPLQAERDRLRVGARAVDLPFLGRPHRWALARAGFVVASAPDSQRLWVVETA